MINKLVIIHIVNRWFMYGENKQEDIYELQCYELKRHSLK